MIQTVLGPVDASTIGRVSMHDHLLIDGAGLHREGVEPTPADSRVTMENLGYLRWNCLGLVDNLVLDDDDVAVDELRRAVAGGITLLVEDTAIGLNPQHARLPGIARRSGMAVAAAYGPYMSRVLPPWMAELDEQGLEDHLHAALADRIPGTDYRAALLGILGTSGDVLPDEWMRLRAAARAAARTGATVSVRLDPDYRAGIAVVEHLVAAGLPADRILFTNADEYMDTAYWAELSAAGATLEMCFGSEMQHVGRIRNPTDLERIDFFAAFLADHPATTWVLGGSLWTKTQLSRFGGQGYDHLTRRIVPELGRRGVGADLLEPMLTTQPVRLLDRPD
jgi:phosphotriesterase-related protein